MKGVKVYDGDDLEQDWENHQEQIRLEPELTEPDEQYDESTADHPDVTEERS